MASSESNLLREGNMKKLVSGVVALALFGCASDPGHGGGGNRSNVFLTEAGRARPASVDTPSETLAELQTCVDQLAQKVSPDMYAVLFDITATDDGKVGTVKVNDSMIAGNDIEKCLQKVLSQMDMPAAATNHLSSHARSTMGVVQAAAAPIALLPIVLVAGGVTILVGVTIYAGTEVIEAARRRPVITKSRCLDAAAGGTFLWQDLCRAIRDAKKAERCWALGPESEEEKRNWCNEAFGTW